MVRHRPAKGGAGFGRDDRVFSDKKIAYFKHANELFDQYEKIIVIMNDNVQSNQMQNIRISLRGLAIILMGKNTTIKKVLLDRTTRDPENVRDKMLYDKLVGDKLLKDNVGLVFTNGDLAEIKKVIDGNKVQAPARQGAIAPLDVYIPPGNTGLEPTKTSFFQALNINTKITKGTVEILKEELILKTGDKVGSSEATLLAMLGVKPFFYGMEIQKIYDNGQVYDKKVLEMTDEDMAKMFEGGISQVTGLSLGTGITTEASLPHLIGHTFKSFLAVSVATEWVMESCNAAELREAVLSGKGLGGPAPAASAAPAAAEAAPAAAAPVEEEEEEDDDMGFGLFD